MIVVKDNKALIGLIKSRGYNIRTAGNDIEGLGDIH